MSPTVHTPVKGFTGTVAGIDFTDGVGTTSDEVALSYFERQGYTIDPPEDTGPVFPEGAPVEAWTVKQLTAWAKAHEVDLGGAKSKPEILAVVLDPNTPKTATPGEPLPVVPADPSTDQTDLD